MTHVMTEDQLRVIEGIVRDVGELQDEARVRLLSMVATLLPVARDPRVGAALVTVTPAPNGYVGIGLSTYNLEEAHVVASLETAAAMVQRRTDRPLGEAPETMQ